MVSAAPSTTVTSQLLITRRSSPAKRRLCSSRRLRAARATSTRSMTSSTHATARAMIVAVLIAAHWRTPTLTASFAIPADYPRCGTANQRAAPLAAGPRWASRARALAIRSYCPGDERAFVSTNGNPTGGFDAQACVIGAGPSGLAAAKALVDRGIDFDWFEKGSMVGGLWRIDNDNGGAAAYETLHLNSSRPLTQYPSYPMPADWPDYPSHRLMATYFQDFADHFGLTVRISFNTPVEHVEPLPGPGRPGSGGWSVTTPAGTRSYRYLL